MYFCAWGEIPRKNMAREGREKKARDGPFALPLQRNAGNFPLHLHPDLLIIDRIIRAVPVRTDGLPATCRSRRSVFNYLKEWAVP